MRMSKDRSVRGGAGRFLGTVVLLLTLTVPGVAAGPVLESALRVADRVTMTPMTCADADAAGEVAANGRRWPVFWFGGSWTAGVLLVPIVPLLARRDREPPDEVLAVVPPPTVECFRKGYQRADKRRRARAAWAGWAIGAAVAGTFYARNALSE